MKCTKGLSGTIQFSSTPLDFLTFQSKDDRLLTKTQSSLFFFFLNILTFERCIIGQAIIFITLICNTKKQIIKMVHLVIDPVH